MWINLLHKCIIHSLIRVLLSCLFCILVSSTTAEISGSILLVIIVLWERLLIGQIVLFPFRIVMPPVRNPQLHFSSLCWGYYQHIKTGYTKLQLRTLNVLVFWSNRETAVSVFSKVTIFWNDFCQKSWDSWSSRHRVLFGKYTWKLAHFCRRLQLSRYPAMCINFLSCLQSMLHNEHSYFLLMHFKPSDQTNCRVGMWAPTISTRWGLCMHTQTLFK